jgi:hypothetical protein
VQNFGVTGRQHYGTQRGRRLAGHNQGTLYNTYSTGTVTVDPTATSTDPVFGIGGLVGMSNGDIFRRRSSATVSAAGGQQEVQEDPLNPGVPGVNGRGMQGGIGGLVESHRAERCQIRTPPAA